MLHSIKKIKLFPPNHLFGCAAHKKILLHAGTEKKKFHFHRLKMKVTKLKKSRLLIKKLMEKTNLKWKKLNK